MEIGREVGDEGPDVRALIKELAATWIDPFAAYEAVAIEQDAERRAAAAGAPARERPALRVVVPLSSAF